MCLCVYVSVYLSVTVAGIFSRNIGQLSLAQFSIASLSGRGFEYLFWLGVNAGISYLPDDR